MFNLNLTKELWNLLFQKSLPAVLMNSSSPNEDFITGYEINHKLGYIWANRTSAIIDLRKKIERIQEKLIIARGQDDLHPTIFAVACLLMFDLILSQKN